jgi:hypothetical protein
MNPLQPDPRVDGALVVAIERRQEVVSQERELEPYAEKTLATLRFLVRQIAISSQVFLEQAEQFRCLIALLDTVPGVK